MQATQRHNVSDVIERLGDAPYRFQFVQAVRLLLRRLRAQGIDQDEAFRTILRFQNSLALNFPASEIEQIKFSYPARADVADPHIDGDDDIPLRVTLTPAFFGLLGVHGVLPLHHSERFAALQPRESDASARAFLDVFSNRMVACFYAAWGKYRVEHALDMTGRDTLLPMLGALSGTLPARAAACSEIDEVAGYYTGLLRTRPISASAVARILSDYFEVPITIEEFVGCWDPIPDKMRTILGAKAAQLGGGFTLGTRKWRSDLRVRLCIGPLHQEALDEFLPNGRGVRALEKMLGALSIPCMQYEARLILRRASVRTLTLRAAGQSQGQRLGWSTFIATDTAAVASPEVRFMLRPTP